MPSASLRLQSILSRSVVLVILLFLAALAIYPLVFMALSSFKSSSAFLKSPIGFPTGFSNTENYRAMYTNFEIPRLYVNTIVCIVGASIVSLVLSIPASYAFAKLRFPFRDGLRLIMIAALIVPVITFVVPSYVMMAGWNLISTYRVLILLWSATAVPGNILLLSSLMRGIPNEVLEAARIDGAGYFETMRRAVVPLSLPGIVTVSIFNVTTWWNDLLIPLIFIQKGEKMTVTVGVATIVGRFSVDYPLLLTGLLLTSIPPVIVYVLLQGTIRRGLVIGAVR